MSVGAYLIGGKDLAKKTSLGYNLSGMASADAAAEAADIQAEAGREAVGLARETRDIARADLAPFRNFGQSNIAGLQNILSPQGQADYLRNNPLFNIAMDNLNRSSNNTFLGRGKLGDATDQLTKNAFLAGQPLLQQQTGNLFNAVNLGQSSAAGQANTSLQSGQSINDLITGIANSQAGGLVGGANARQGGASSFFNAFGGLFGGAMASDRRLKRNIVPRGTHGPYQVYDYQYLWSDDWYRGVMADEVALIKPSAVIRHASGYDLVNYGAL
jgi:hypothetical protein